MSYYTYPLRIYFRLLYKNIQQSLYLLHSEQNQISNSSILVDQENADIQSKVEELEQLNQSVRQRDKAKRRYYNTIVRSARGFISKITGYRKATGFRLCSCHNSLT